MMELESKSKEELIEQLKTTQAALQTRNREFEQLADFLEQNQISGDANIHEQQLEQIKLEYQEQIEQAASHYQKLQQKYDLLLQTSQNDFAASNNFLQNLEPELDTRLRNLQHQTQSIASLNKDPETQPDYDLLSQRVKQFEAMLKMIFDFFRVHLDPEKKTEKTVETEQKTSDKQASAAGLKILVVEDNPINTRVAYLHLGKMGFDVSDAEDGLIAVDILSKQKFDIVLMDLEMPNMDGLTTIKAIRNQEFGILDPDVPIITTTAHAIAGMRDKCIAAGANDFITKPLDFKQLKSMINQYLDGTMGTAIVETPPPVTPPPRPTSSDEAKVLEEQDVVMEKLGVDDLELLQDLYQIFLDDIPSTIDEFNRGFEQNDLTIVGKTAHKLKSSAASIGATACHQSILRLEEAIKQGEAEQSKIEFEQLQKELQKIKTELS